MCVYALPFVAAACCMCCSHDMCEGGVTAFNNHLCRRIYSVCAGWAAAMQPANILCRACQQACQYPAAMLFPILCLLWVCDSHSHRIRHTLHAP